jgi:hypothetical protein
MLKVEELFERVKAHQEWASQWDEIDFWQALYEVLDEIVYYGGADIECCGEIYRVRTDTDAVKLLLDLYRNEICEKEKGNAPI